MEFTLNPPAGDVIPPLAELYKEKRETWGRTFAYFNSRGRADHFRRQLQELGVSAAFVHGETPKQGIFVKRTKTDFLVLFSFKIFGGCTFVL